MQSCPTVYLVLVQDNRNKAVKKWTLSELWIESCQNLIFQVFRQILILDLKRCLFSAVESLRALIQSSDTLHFSVIIRLQIAD